MSKEDLAPYVEDALNELEFLLGDISTKYGALRASLGYPEPWKIKYVEVGNEDNLAGGKPSYNAYRWSMFYNAIHAAYPDILVISSVQDLSSVGAPHTSATDFHQYLRPDDFAAQFNLFDHNNRNYPILLGEYAVIQPNANGAPVDWNAPKMPYGTWIGAVGEAIYLLGSERNGDVVLGASYAPGFQNVNNFQWTVRIDLLPIELSLTLIAAGSCLLQRRPIKDCSILQLASTSGMFIHLSACASVLNMY